MQNFPFDPGSSTTSANAFFPDFSTAHLQDGDIVIDSGAGRGIKPSMHGLVNPTKSNTRIVWGDGSSTSTCIEASLPGHQLPRFIVAPSAHSTLVSVGSNTENTSDCYSFFDKHTFLLSGLQIFKDRAGDLDARFVGPKKDRVKYIGSKPKPGDIYKAPSFDVFKPGETGAWRFDDPTGDQEISLIAGPPATAFPQQTIHVNSVSVVDTVFAGHTIEQRNSIKTILQQPDFVEAYEYTVADMNANQQRMALNLIRKHYSFGHAPRSVLRQILQQSHVKADRDLARHVDLMPTCNCCLQGKNKKGAKHKNTTATPSEPTKFLEHIAIDNSGKQNIESVDGYWYFMLYLCTKTNFKWVSFLHSPADSKKCFEEWLRVYCKQHRTFKVKALRHDGGKADFGNNAFKKLLEKYEITREQTGGTSTNNSKAERGIGVTTTDSNTNMIWCQGPRTWWSWSISYAVTTRNLLPTSTNPGHMSPYEYAFSRKPNYSMLVPFGCLAYAVVKTSNKCGKTNYRKQSRICAMIGYELKPDGHPLSYKLYDCDLGTVIRRTDDLVTFNKDMPALKFIAERAVQRPVDLFSNAVVAKYFGSKKKRKLHWGKVISHRYDTDGELLFRISYEDGDWEEFNLAEMMIHSRLAAVNDRGHDFTVPAAPKSRKKRKLSQVLKHAKSILPSPNKPTTGASASTVPDAINEPTIEASASTVPAATSEHTAEASTSTVSDVTTEPAAEASASTVPDVTKSKRPCRKHVTTPVAKTSHDIFTGLFAIASAISTLGPSDESEIIEAFVSAAADAKLNPSLTEASPSQPTVPDSDQI